MNLSTDVDRSTRTFYSSFLFFFVVEVLLKCRWSANSQQPAAPATDLPLLTSPLSTVSWSNTACFNNLWESFYNTFFCLWTSVNVINKLLKKVTKSRHHTDIATYTMNWARGLFSESICIKINLNVTGENTFDTLHWRNICTPYEQILVGLCLGFRLRDLSALLFILLSN